MLEITKDVFIYIAFIPVLIVLVAWIITSKMNKDISFRVTYLIALTASLTFVIIMGIQNEDNQILYKETKQLLIDLSSE